MKYWMMIGQFFNIVEDNDHSGQIISGTDQTQKNVNRSINQSRNALYPQFLLIRICPDR